MATSFPNSSSPNSPVHQESGNDSGEIHPSPTGSSQGQAKAKARKQDGGATSSGKRIPQRGLGVAQLERIRLQEHFEKLSSGGIDNSRQLINPQQHPLQIRHVPPQQPQPALYNNQQYVRTPVSLGFPVPCHVVPGRDPPPSPAAPVPAMDSNWHLNRCITPAKVAAGYGGPQPTEDARSNVLQEQQTVDLFRTTVGDTRLLRSIGAPYQGPPSTQTRQWNSPYFDFFERKSQFGEGPNQTTMHFIDFFKGNAPAVHQEAFQVDGLFENKPMKEIDFFPVRSNITTSTSSHASISSPPAAPAPAPAPAPASASTSASEPTFLDLSLKL